MGSGPVRPSTYTATIIGAHAGGNVARELAGKPTKPLSFGYAIQSISLGRGDGRAQFTDGYDGPFAWVVTGRLAARIKDAVERFAVVGPLRRERLVPGAYARRPAPMAYP